MNEKPAYPWHSCERGEAEFSSTYNTCCFNGHTYTKVKGGARGGNSQDEDGDVYRISQH